MKAIDKIFSIKERKFFLFACLLTQKSAVASRPLCPSSADKVGSHLIKIRIKDISAPFIKMISKNDRFFNKKLENHQILVILLVAAKAKANEEEVEDFLPEGNERVRLPCSTPPVLLKQ
jgi:hypothetical protein